MTTSPDDMVAQLRARGLTVEPASGGPIPDSEAERHDAASITLEQPGPQIMRVTGDALDVTVPATALGVVIANLDTAAQQSESP